jgi:signal transduction histidine kinase/ActR/RegA family two-component response regulator
MDDLMIMEKHMSASKGISCKKLLATFVVGISIVVYSPIIYTIYYSNDSTLGHERDGLKRLMEHQFSSIIGSAADDHALISVVLDRMAEHPSVYSVTLTDADGETLGFVKNDIAGLNELRFGTREVAVFTPDNTQVGSLLVSYIDRYREDSSLSPLLKSIFASAILGLLSLVVFYFVLRSQSRAMMDMISSASQLAAGSRGIRLSEDSPIAEFLQFSRSFNSIAMQLESRWDVLDRYEQLYELKANVLQIAAHELRTPLASIRTFLDIAIHHNLQQRPADVLSTLRKCFSDFEALDRHITSILCLSALENGSLQRNDQWVDVGKLFDDLDKQFAVKCQSKGQLSWACFCCSPNSASLTVLIDYDIASIIISNAIDNAVKYTNRGFVKVAYDVVDGKLVVIVHDSGVGMSDSSLEALKNSNDNIISRTRDGWGIGLSTMYRFSELLGGNIEIDSKEGFGTKVSISIPIGSEDASLGESQGSGDLELEGGTYIHNVVEGGLSLLVIDNDAQYLRQVEELLSPRFIRRDDVQVTFCSSSSDAIRCVEDCEYDLIFIDYHMPGIDGLQFLRFLRDSENQCKNSETVIVTADANIPEQVRSEMQSMGCRVLSKGLTSADINSIIRSVSLKSVS